MGDVFKEAIKKKGLFKFDDLYNFCYDWFMHKDYLLHEKQYFLRKTDFGDEIRLEWEAHKKFNDYYNFGISLSWHILGMNKTEVEIAGRKEEMHKGEVKLTIKGSLMSDYEGRWSQTQFTKQLHAIYQKFVIGEHLEEHEDLVADDCLELLDALKTYLSLLK